MPFNPLTGKDEDETQAPLNLGLSQQDQKAVGNYASNGVDYDKNAKLAALNKFAAGAQSDPTLQNMLNGMAMGGVGSVEAKAADEALPLVENAGKSIVEGATPMWDSLKASMAGTSPSASSAGADAIAQQAAKVNELAATNGYYHPATKIAQQMLNRMKGY